jgi:hypothetical protein
MPRHVSTNSTRSSACPRGAGFRVIVACAEASELQHAI